MYICVSYIVLKRLITVLIKNNIKLVRTKPEYIITEFYCRVHCERKYINKKREPIILFKTLLIVPSAQNFETLLIDKIQKINFGVHNQDLKILRRVSYNYPWSK